MQQLWWLASLDAMRRLARGVAYVRPYSTCSPIGRPYRALRLGDWLLRGNVLASPELGQEPLMLFGQRGVGGQFVPQAVSELA